MQMVAEFTFNVMRGNESRGWCYVICVDVVLALSGGGGMFHGRERRRGASAAETRQEADQGWRGGQPRRVQATVTRSTNCASLSNCRGLCIRKCVWC